MSTFRWLKVCDSITGTSNSTHNFGCWTRSGVISFGKQRQIIKRVFSMFKIKDVMWKLKAVGVKTLFSLRWTHRPSRNILVVEPRLMSITYHEGKLCSLHNMCLLCGHSSPQALPLSRGCWNRYFKCQALILLINFGRSEMIFVNNWKIDFNATKYFLFKYSTQKGVKVYQYMIQN